MLTCKLKFRRWGCNELRLFHIHVDKRERGLTKGDMERRRTVRNSRAGLEWGQVMQYIQTDAKPKNGKCSQELP